MIRDCDIMNFCCRCLRDEAVRAKNIVNSGERVVWGGEKVYSLSVGWKRHQTSFRWLDFMIEANGIDKGFVFLLGRYLEADLSSIGCMTVLKSPPMMC